MFANLAFNGCYLEGAVNSGQTVSNGQIAGGDSLLIKAGWCVARGIVVSSGGRETLSSGASGQCHDRTAGRVSGARFRCFGQWNHGQQRRRSGGQLWSIGRWWLNVLSGGEILQGGKVTGLTVSSGAINVLALVSSGQIVSNQVYDNQMPQVVLPGGATVDTTLISSTQTVAGGYNNRHRRFRQTASCTSYSGVYPGTNIVFRNRRGPARRSFRAGGDLEDWSETSGTVILDGGQERVNNGSVCLWHGRLQWRRTICRPWARQQHDRFERRASKRLSSVKRRARFVGAGGSEVVFLQRCNQRRQRR